MWNQVTLEEGVDRVDASLAGMGAGEPTVGFQVGYTPLVKADRLAKRLGIRELWVKNDTVNYPSLSFKDRVVSVALSRARGR